MRSIPQRRSAPRASRAGALAHRGATFGLAVALCLVGHPLAGQTPPDTLPAPPDTASADTPTPPDTLPPDTLPADTVPGDTIPADSLDLVQLDTLDSLPADSAEAEPLENLPALPELVPEGFETAVWAWDREELLANRALTLAELLEQIPGAVGLRGGDYGTPRLVTALGAGGGGVRVFRDGVEVLPLEGSVPDLARIALGGLERVRVHRAGSGLRIELESVRPDDRRPYSLVQAGTGDLDTNLFRGAFVHPAALGGNVALALDRIDTRGPGGGAPGAVSSVWLRYSYLRGDRFGLVAEFNRATADRDTLFSPGEVTRTDWTLRSRARLTEGVVADAFWSSASLEADSAGPELEPFPFRTESRGQLGGALTLSRGPVAARASARSFTGEGLPAGRISAEISASDTAYGGVAASWSRERWPERAPSRRELRGWTAPLYGFSLFGSVEEYERGVPYLPPLPPEPPDDGEDEPDGEEPADEPGAKPDPAPDSVPGPRFTRGTSARFGGRFRWRDLELSGARLVAEADTLHPFGLPVDRTGRSLPGGDRRRGWEIAFRVPLLADGLAVTGSGQLWERAGDTASTGSEADAGEVFSRPYLPRRTWNAALRYHDTFYPTENLEIWADVGVLGRDRMRVPVPPLEPEEQEEGEEPSAEVATVPFYQSWYARLQIRVVTVRVFITWENFTVRSENLDFPGRALPATRALYGVRWTLWN